MNLDDWYVLYSFIEIEWKFKEYILKFQIEKNCNLLFFILKICYNGNEIKLIKEENGLLLITPLFPLETSNRRIRK